MTTDAVAAAIVTPLPPGQLLWLIALTGCGPCYLWQPSIIASGVPTSAHQLMVHGSSRSLWLGLESTD